MWSRVCFCPALALANCGWLSNTENTLPCAAQTSEMGILCSKQDVAEERTPQNLSSSQLSTKSLSEYRDQLILLHDKHRHEYALEKEDFCGTIFPESALTGVQQRFMNVFSHPFTSFENFRSPVYTKSNEEIELLENALIDNFIFSGLTTQERTLLVNAMQEHCALLDDVIIKQGDIGDYFYVLIKGSVAFMVDEKLVEEVSSRAAFGELALLYDAPRAATVKAITDCILYRVDQNTFRAIMAYNNYQSEKKRVQLLQSMDIFKGVEPHALGKIAKAMTQVVLHDGQILFRKGDKGEIFYVIQSGKIKITDFGICSTEQKTLHPGDFFGERALITGEKRSATATAVGDTTLYCVSRESFENLCGSLGDLIHHTSRKRILMNIPIFADANLEPQELDRLSKMMTSVTFDKGVVLIEEGKPITDVPIGLYLIRVGEISITTSTGPVAHLKRDDYFGEDFFYKEDGFSPSFTVTVNEMTICYVLTGKSMSVALGGIDRLKRKSSAIHTILDSSITLETLSKVKNIGIGTFGKVYLVIDKRNETRYALKIQDKRDVIKWGQPNAILRERKLMASVQHPFVCKLFNCFQDDIFLYMVVEYGDGGDLLSAIDANQPAGLTEDLAQFYAANVFDALMHLHGRCILFRDLKPENVVIGGDGYCFLIDFGFAKIVTDKTYTLCGTPPYLAPEVIFSRGYEKGVDNWAFAVLVFHMIFGYTPFYSSGIGKSKLYKRIVTAHYSFPCKTVSGEAKDLISKILVTDNSRRLGSLVGGDDDIRNHSWLAKLSESDMTKKCIKAPRLTKLTFQAEMHTKGEWEFIETVNRTNKLTGSQQLLFKDF